MSEEVAIGLEIHIQLLTRSKLFCSCSTDYIGKEPNTNVCPVCLGLPGSLPVLNKKAIELAVKTALALNCKINRVSLFHRKNYFYPDLPKNYQISQYDFPLAENGYLEISCPEIRKDIKVGIIRLHLEEDAGKLVHKGEITRANHSWVDYNRTGIPLAEIVTQPELHSPEEAQLFLIQLRNLVKYLGVCDGNMEEGSLRCDANISIRDKKTGALGTKTEIKNLNSFRSVRNALEFELKRQKIILEQGGKIVQETRHWNEEKKITISMRSKEEAPDYRYFPEPDLLPLRIEQEMITKISKNLPELPEQRRKRLIREYHLSEKDAQMYTEHQTLGDYFEQAAVLFPDKRMLNNWIKVELLGCLSKEKISIEYSPVSPERLVGLLKLITQGLITGKIGKTILERMISTGQEASQIIQESKIKQINDQDEIIKIIDLVIKENNDSIEDLKNGKGKALNYLIGQVMRYTKGRAKPELVREMMKKKLNL
ncbi:MAG: Asp-tRNA(Asn)/Glu-tRNA(Gln) amidotransferase subunit GatB [Candidatus Caldatribacteriota bacterium]